MNITPDWSNEPINATDCGRLALVSIEGGLPQEVRRKVEVPGRYNLFDAVTRRAKKIVRKSPDRNHVVTDYHLTSESSAVQMLQLRTHGFVIDAILRYEFVSGSMTHEEFHGAICEAAEGVARMLVERKFGSECTK
jgi:hypothetical protein